MCDFGLKIVIFDPFQSLTLEGKKFLTFQTWLKKSLVSPTWGQGAKLAWKMSFKGLVGQMCNFGLKIVIFGLFQSLPLGEKKILTFQTWFKKSRVLTS